MAPTVWPKSARSMVEALIAAERHPAVLADLAKGRMRTKPTDLTVRRLEQLGYDAILEPAAA